MAGSGRTPLGLSSTQEGGRSTVPHVGRQQSAVKARPPIAHCLHPWNWVQSLPVPHPKGGAALPTGEARPKNA